MRRFILALSLLLLVAPAAARAQAGIRVTEMERVRIDGALGEWQGATFTTVGHGPDASMRFALGHDGDSLYVAAEVWDDRMVRTSSPGGREDAIVLTLALPHGSRHEGFDILLFAGVAGRAAASASMGPVGGRARPLASAQVVEGPLARGHGYSIEAKIPFSALPGGSRWDQARASIRLRDVDTEAHPEIEAEPALVAVDPRHLERLLPLMPTGGASGALADFLDHHGLGAARPSHDLSGDVLGDGRPERVYLVERFLVITGAGLRDGAAYAYHELPIERGTDVRSAQLRDLTGDGKAELVIVLRQRNAQGERDLYSVMSLSAEPPRQIFGIEIRKAVGQAFVEARVRIAPARGRRPPEIEVRTHRADGLDAETLRESPASDVEPMLVPWGPVASRTYRWDGTRFARTGERPNPRYVPPEERPTTTAATPPPPPAPPSVEALLTAFRRERGIPRGARERFRASANMVGDREPEVMVVYGRQLVIVGPGIQDGRSWMFYEIPAASDDDVLGVEAVDVTGDRRAEVLVRVRQTFGEVQRILLIAHQVTERGFPRLLQVEIAREQGSGFVRNEVLTRGGRLEIRPGQAHGFGADHWPFTRAAQDDAEPLLLPWADRPVRYRLQGGRLSH